jgi:hypothetical protein
MPPVPRGGQIKATPRGTGGIARCKTWQQSSSSRSSKKPAQAQAMQAAARTSRALGAVCGGAWAELFWERDDGDMPGLGARGAFGVEAGAGQWERAGVGGRKWE